MKGERKRAEPHPGEITSARRARREDAAPRDNVVAIASARRRARRSADEPVKPSDGDAPSAAPESSRELEVLVDGKRVVVEADRELVLRCGKASITLTRAGKIILRGTHVVSRSSGANRVQGTQVRIN